MKQPSQKSGASRVRSPAKSQAIMVLGMHRSGTSATTRVLNLLGCALPSDLIGAGDGNELGHWESQAAVALNDEILATAGSSWEDWGPINKDWRDSGVRAAMLDRITLLIQDHSKLGPLFALKDPRLCRLADLWLDGMDAAGINPLVLLMMRNPLEVVASLENRDLMPSGYGQLLWLRHVLDSEYFTRGRKRIVCRYDQLMRNWCDVAERIKSGLGVALPRNSPVVHAEIEAFLSSHHRHHEANANGLANNPSLSAWLRRSFAILHEWSEHGENAADHAELDQIRGEFDRAYAAFARMLLPGRASGELGSGSQLKRELAARIAEAEQATDVARQNMLAAETQRAEYQARIDGALAETQQLQADIAHLRAEAERLGYEAAQADVLRAREAELTAQIAAGSELSEQLQADIAHLRAEAERLGHEAAQADVLRAREAELTAQIAAESEISQQLQSDIVQLRAENTRLAQLATEADAQRAQAADLALQLENLRNALAESQADAERQRQQRIEIQNEISTRQADQRDLELRNAELTGRCAAAESALLQRQEELSQLWNQLLAAESARTAAEIMATQERERQLEAPPSPPDHLFAELAELTRLLQQQEAATVAAQAQLVAKEQAFGQLGDENRQLVTQLQNQENAAQNAERARAATEQKLAARFDEVARLTAMLADEAGKSAVAETDAAWLAGMVRTAQGFPKWWALMPAAWRRPREHARYRRAGLFDAARYLEIYPDVAAEGMDPVRHYILHGMAERRQRPQ